jgi:hypothetical protein
MNTEFSAFATAANNPFAALMSPELVIAAHERMSARTAGVVHRPLDKPRLVKAGHDSFVVVDDEVDMEEFDDVDGALELAVDMSDISDIVSSNSGRLF